MSKATNKANRSIGWVKRKVAVAYCRRSRSAVKRVYNCRTCPLRFEGRDCRGNPIGHRDVLVSQAEEKARADMFNLMGLGDK